jgi:hypothetical protein
MSVTKLVSQTKVLSVNRVLFSNMILVYGLAQIKPQKTPAPPILTEIIPNRLYISNLEGAQNINKIVVC